MSSTKVSLTVKHSSFDHTFYLPALLPRINDVVSLHPSHTRWLAPRHAYSIVGKPPRGDFALNPSEMSVGDDTEESTEKVPL